MPVAVGGDRVVVEDVVAVEGTAAELPMGDPDPGIDDVDAHPRSLGTVPIEGVQGLMPLVDPVEPPWRIGLASRGDHLTVHFELRHPSVGGHGLCAAGAQLGDLESVERSFVEVAHPSSVESRQLRGNGLRRGLARETLPFALERHDVAAFDRRTAAWGGLGSRRGGKGGQKNQAGEVFPGGLLPGSWLPDASRHGVLLELGREAAKPRPGSVEYRAGQNEPSPLVAIPRTQQTARNSVIPMKDRLGRSELREFPSFSCVRR